MGLRFLTAETFPHLFEFPADMGPLPSDVNRLDNQILVRIYDEEWRKLALHE